MLNRKLFSLTLTTCLLFFYSCDSENKSTDVYSYEFNDKSEKLSYLKKYITKESGLEDAEYHIWFQDNGADRLPAPSDWNIRVAIKVNPDSINSWISHLDSAANTVSIDKWKDLKLDRKIWKLNSNPEMYHSKSKSEIKLVYRKENVILAFYTTNPNG